MADASSGPVEIDQNSRERELVDYRSACEKFVPIFCSFGIEAKNLEKNKLKKIYHHADDNKDGAPKLGGATIILAKKVDFKAGKIGWEMQGYAEFNPNIYWHIRVIATPEDAKFPVKVLSVSVKRKEGNHFNKNEESVTGRTEGVKILQGVGLSLSQEQWFTSLPLVSSPAPSANPGTGQF